MVSSHSPLSRASSCRTSNHTTDDLRKIADLKKVQFAMSKRANSKGVHIHKKVLYRARSQRYRERNKLNKTNERRRKDGLPHLSLNFLGEAHRPPAAIVAIHPAPLTAPALNPTRRSQRRVVTAEADSTVKVAEPAESLNVGFYFQPQDAKTENQYLKKARRDLATLLRRVWRLDKDASRHTKNADVKKQSDEDSFSCSNSDNSASPVISSPTSPGTANGPLRTNTPHQSCSTDDNLDNYKTFLAKLLQEKKTSAIQKGLCFGCMPPGLPSCLHGDIR